MKKGGHYSRKTLFKEILLFFPDLSFRLSGNKSNNLKYLSFRKSWNNSNNLKSKIGPGILPKRGSKYTFFTMIMSKTFYIPYDLPSSVHFQMGIRAPKRHLFDRQFCVGLLHIFCKHGPKGRGKILKFWPLQSARQNDAGFRRGLFTCFWGHTPYNCNTGGVAPKAGITVLRGMAPKAGK